MTEDITNFIDQGKKHPYDESPAGIDWARLAALGIMANLYNRMTLQGVLAIIDLDRRREMVDTCAEIIRVSAVEHNGFPGQPA